jgi:uncharacterized protein YndB with AHSA1/START domain
MEYKPNRAWHDPVFRLSEWIGADRHPDDHPQPRRGRARVTSERSTCNTQFVAAPPQAVWGAFMDPARLVAWLPPGGMSGAMHAFDGRVGGGYRMSLFYPADDEAAAGKTAQGEDQVVARFLELVPPARIVQAFEFVTGDPQLNGTARLTTTLEPVPGGTQVTMRFDDLPPGVRPQDNEEGARLSLAQLAALFA